MTVAEIYDLLNYISNKSQTGNTLTPKEFNSVIHAAQLRHFKRKVGLPEEYQPGAPVPRQSFEITQKITDDLMPFKVYMGAPNTMPLSIASNGTAIVPGDMYYPSALSYDYFPVGCNTDPEKRMIDVLTDAQWDDIAGNSLKRPTSKYPVCNFQSGYIRFLPKDLQFVHFVYLRYPVKPVYDYYIKANGEYVYLAPGQAYALQPGEEGSQGQINTTVVSQSVEIEWDEVNQLDIIYLMADFVGINLREMPLMQYANMMKQQGA
jgi:hypothetical protein